MPERHGSQIPRRWNSVGSWGPDWVKREKDLHGLCPQLPQTLTELPYRSLLTGGVLLQLLQNVELGNVFRLSKQPRLLW